MGKVAGARRPDLHDHVAFAQRDHRLDRASAFHGAVVEQVEPLLAGRGIGAAQLDALGRGEGGEPARERDRLQERGARLDLDEDGRRAKRSKFGGVKYVYPAETMRELRGWFTDELDARLPQARLLYWT